MLRLARWCVAHRRRVVLAWIAVAIVMTVVAHAVGPNYVSVFSLPGTDSQRAHDLLTKDFPVQSGDADAIVFEVSSGTIDAPAVRAAITPLLARVSAQPHVAAVVSPYSALGAVQVSRNRMTAFATVDYDKPANSLAPGTGKPENNTCPECCAANKRTMKRQAPTNKMSARLIFGGFLRMVNHNHIDRPFLRF